MMCHMVSDVDVGDVGYDDDDCRVVVVERILVKLVT